MPIFLFMVISFLGVWGDESFGSVCLHGIGVTLDIRWRCRRDLNLQGFDLPGSSVGIDSPSSLDSFFFIKRGDFI